jgi:hypothetical protein
MVYFFEELLHCYINAWFLQDKAGKGTIIKATVRAKHILRPSSVFQMTIRYIGGRRSQSFSGTAAGQSLSDRILDNNDYVSGLRQRG